MKMNKIIVSVVLIVMGFSTAVHAALQSEGADTLKISDEQKRFIELEQLYLELGDITEWESFDDEQMEKLVHYYKKSYENKHWEIYEMFNEKTDEYLKILDVQIGSVWFYQNYERPFMDGIIYTEEMNLSGELVYLAMYFLFNCDNHGYPYLGSQLTVYRMPMTEEETEHLENLIKRTPEEKDSF